MTGRKKMINEEGIKILKSRMDDRTEDLISQIQSHENAIANIVKSAYERGYADGKASKARSNGIIIKFGDLKLGDKFKIYDGSFTYMKVVLFDEDEDEGKYLACNTVTFACRAMRDSHLVIPIKDGD